VLLSDVTLVSLLNDGDGGDIAVAAAAVTTSLIAAAIAVTPLLSALITLMANYNYDDDDSALIAQVNSW
jgi:hypothetical protein